MVLSFSEKYFGFRMICAKKMKHLLNLNLLGSDINRCFAYLQCFKRDYREITCNFLIMKSDIC